MVRRARDYPRRPECRRQRERRNDRDDLYFGFNKLSLGLSVACWRRRSRAGSLLFLPLILIMVIFYFLMILPAQRRQKKVNEMLERLEERR